MAIGQKIMPTSPITAPVRKNSVQTLGTQRPAVSYSRNSQSGTRTGNRGSAPGQAVAATVRRNAGRGKSPLDIPVTNPILPSPTELLGPPPTGEIGLTSSSNPVHPSARKSGKY